MPHYENQPLVGVGSVTTEAINTRLTQTADPVIDEEKFFNMRDPMAKKFVDGLKQKDEARRARLAPPGSLGLAPLLDERRIEFLIPDEAFREQPLYDRIFVFQISMWKGETYGDTVVVMPPTIQDAEKFSNPRGVLVAAGPIALDELRSNGCDLGHIITFIKLAPWRLQIASHGGHDDHILILRSCDVIASEDLARALRAGDAHVEEFHVEKDGRVFVTHIIKDARRGAAWHPQQPTIPEDY